MAKKHLFISIGSTSTAALTTLIERLTDFGIYRPFDVNYKDMFVAIDTDRDPLDRILTYNQGDIAHTYAIRFFRSGDDNVPSHRFLTDSYRPDWAGDTMKILAAHRGVGGRRVKSFATLEWRDELGTLIGAFFKGVPINNQALLDDYQVVLVSSSWGGTASGMFENVADFIAEKVFECCGGANNLTPFYTVLALPNYEAARRIRDDADYQGLENIAYFMRSVQQAGWRGSLGKLQDENNTKLNFVIPEFCDLDNDGEKITVNEDGAKAFCGTLSTLPQRAIVIVPTMSSATTAVTVAEHLLLLSYLEVLNKPTRPNNGVTADGEFVNDRAGWDQDPTQECPVLIGINMVECQYSKEAVIDKTIATRMIDIWKRFYSDNNGKDTGIKRYVQNFIKECIVVPEGSRKNFANVLNALNDNWMYSAQQINEFKDAVSNFVEVVEDEAYDFPRYEDADGLLARFVQYVTTDADRKKVPSTFVTLKDIRDAYLAQLDDWYKQAQPENESLVESLVTKIKRMIDNTARQYGKIQSDEATEVYGKISRIIKYCNGKQQVINEFLDIARQAIKNELLELQKIMLAKAIVRQRSLTKRNEVKNNDNWGQTNIFVEDLKTNNDATYTVSNGFIKNVYNETLEKKLKNIVQVTVGHCIELLINSATKVDLQSCYEKLRADIRIKTIQEMGNKKIDGVNDTSMITLKDANLTGCCPPFYAESPTASMYHFYFKNTGAADITWIDVEKMGFRSFVNAKSAEVNMETGVDYSHIDFNRAGKGACFNTDVKYDGKSLYGMWLGSVNMGLSFQDVLKGVYDARDLGDIQTAATNLECATQSHKQCHQTLFEKVAIGAVLGAIDEKVKTKTLSRGEALTLTVKTPDGEKIWSKTSQNCNELGLSQDHDGMRIQCVYAEFIRTLMSWMRDENGTCKFAKKFKCEQLYKTLFDQERFVLTKMRLTPTQEQAAYIVEFCNAVKDCIEVSTSRE